MGTIAGEADVEESGQLGYYITDESGVTGEELIRVKGIHRQCVD